MSTDSQKTRPSNPENVPPRHLSASMLEKPPVFPGYSIVEKLGEGGMGAVFLADQQQPRRKVVIKVILSRALDSDGDVALHRFREEANALAALQHPHFVPIYAFDEEPFPHLVMEYLPGGSLQQRLKKPIHTFRDAAHLIAVLARSMHVAHQRGLIHRDLKPANILLADPIDGNSGNTVYGFPKIADFGLVRVVGADGPTDTGEIMGSIAYMPPEQARGQLDKIGPATDVYALGAMLYELVTGRVPFVGESQTDVLFKIVQDPAIPPREFAPAVTQELSQICLKCLEKEPDARYRSAAELADDLQHFLKGNRTDEIATPGTPDRQASTVKLPPDAAKSRAPWIVLAGVLALLGTGLFVWAPWGKSGKVEPTSVVMTPTTSKGEPKPEPFKGWFDLRVAKKKTGKLHWLHETPARPLEIGDEIRMVAELNKPGYCYILWIDAKGQVVPFYPWLDGDWSKKLPETKVQRLDLPDGPGVFAIDETSPTGMETIVLLVRDEPLPDEPHLTTLIGQLLPTPKLEDGGRMALWFRNGREVTDEAERAPTIKLPENEVFRTQDLLRTKLGAPTFQYSRAVVFGTRGK